MSTISPSVLPSGALARRSSCSSCWRPAGRDGDHRARNRNKGDDFLLLQEAEIDTMQAAGMAARDQTLA